MTLEQVFYLGQSIAAVGVIASLIFVGLPMPSQRGSRTAMRAPLECYR
jgi:hypothetical protein